MMHTMSLFHLQKVAWMTSVTGDVGSTNTAAVVVSILRHHLVRGSNKS